MWRARSGAHGRVLVRLGRAIAALAVVALAVLLFAAVARGAAELRARFALPRWPPSRSTEASAVRVSVDAGAAAAEGGAAFFAMPTASAVEEPPPSAGLAEAFVDGYCEPFARAVCRARARCCVRADPECEDDLFAACTRRAHEDDMLALHWEIDEAALRECRQELEAAAERCELGDGGEACALVFRVAVDVGEACPSAGPCRGGQCLYGVCVRRPEIGAPAVLGRCAAGLEPGLDGRCQRLRGVGERCFEGDCEAGLVCADRRCRRPGRAAALCSDTSDCARGLVCRSGRCRAGPTWCDDDECGAGLECVGRVEAECVLRGGHGRVRRHEACDDGPSCPSDRVCVATLVGGRCEPPVCDGEEILADFGGRAGEPIVLPR